MDRGPIKRLLIALAAVPLAGAAVALPPLAAARWTAPAFLGEALTGEPAECLAPKADAALAKRLAIGRAAFRTPLLLGGQAARAGLSCNACHRGGHANPGFVFPGLSGDPGTADVTSSVMSSHRGDGLFNPRPIPDLSGPKDRLKIDQAPGGGRLEGFIRGLVVEEFDGPEPSAATLDGLATYVRSLSPGLCGPALPASLDRDLAHADEALRTAIVLVAEGDAGTARLMVASARSTLGLVDERYRVNGLQTRAAGLRAASSQLGSIAGKLEGDPPAAGAALDAWLAGAETWRAPLRRAEPRSLYRPRNLKLRRAPG